MHKQEVLCTDPSQTNFRSTTGASGMTALHEVTLCFQNRDNTGHFWKGNPICIKAELQISGHHHTRLPTTILHGNMFLTYEMITHYCNGYCKTSLTKKYFSIGGKPWCLCCGNKIISLHFVLFHFFTLFFQIIQRSLEEKMAALKRWGKNG